MDMTLREICNTFGISRRAVQGYEKTGLLTSSGKNGRGHLLYDDAAQNRIKKIKFLQQAGFTLKEITNIIDAPNDVLKPVLKKQLQKLKKEKDNLEQLIMEIHHLIETL